MIFPFRNSLGMFPNLVLTGFLPRGAIRTSLPMELPYTTLGELGRGSFSIVYRACKTDDPTTMVALKVFDKWKLSPVQRERIEREREVLSSCNHRNIIKLFDYSETNEHIYMALEYMGGGELFDKLSSRQYIEELETARIMLQLGEAVKYLHQVRALTIMFFGSSHNVIISLIYGDGLTCRSEA